MIAFEVNASWQRHIVVCDNIAEVAKIYNSKYGPGAALKEGV
jgi:hypothetical protein